MREGIWRLYRLYVGDSLKPQRRMVGRFLLYGDTLGVLEDHDDILEKLAPNGVVNEDVLKRLALLDRSPYWELVNEDDIQAGEHPEHLPELQDGGPEEWPAENE